MRYVIEHETRLSFAGDVKEHQCEMRLTPIDDELQRVHEARIEIEPAVELSGLPLQLRLELPRAQLELVELLARVLQAETGR